MKLDSDLDPDPFCNVMHADPKNSLTECLFMYVSISFMNSFSDVNPDPHRFVFWEISWIRIPIRIRETKNAEKYPKSAENLNEK